MSRSMLLSSLCGVYVEGAAVRCAEQVGNNGRQPAGNRATSQRSQLHQQVRCRRRKPLQPLLTSAGRLCD